MARHAASQAASRGAAPASDVASITGSGCEQRPAAAGASTSMFGELSDPMRLKMELVARASASAETALPAIVSIIAGADETHRDAIVTAIMSNQPLREQWERTWAVLRR